MVQLIYKTRTVSEVMDDIQDTLWQFMRHYGILDKFISLIKDTYQGMSCRVIHGGQLSEKFEMTTGVC